MSKKSRRRQKLLERNNQASSAPASPGERNIGAFSGTHSTELAEKLALAGIAGIKVEDQTTDATATDEEGEMQLPPLEVETEVDPTIPEDEPEDPEYAKKMEELELARAAAEAEAEVKAKATVIPPPRQEKKAPKPQTQTSAPPKKPAAPPAVAEQTGPSQLFGVMGDIVTKNGQPIYATVGFTNENGPQEWNYHAEDWYDGFLVQPGMPVSFRLKKAGGRYSLTNVEYVKSTNGLEQIVNKATAAADDISEGECVEFSTTRIAAMVFDCALQYTKEFQEFSGDEALKFALELNGYSYEGKKAGRQSDRHILRKIAK